MGKAGTKFVVCRSSFKYKKGVFWGRMQQWCMIFRNLWNKSILSKPGPISKPADHWIELFQV